MLLAAYGPVTQFAPTVAATLYWRGASGTGVLAALLAGGGANLVFFIWPGLRPWELHAGLYGLVVNVVVLILVSKLTRRAVGEQEKRFLATARGE